MFYMAYLDNKSATDLTGLESYIQEQVDSQKISWFPSQRALVLDGQENSEEVDPVVEALRKIEIRQTSLVNTTMEVTSNIEKLQKLMESETVKRKKQGNNSSQNFSESVKETIGKMVTRSRTRDLSPPKSILKNIDSPLKKSDSPGVLPPIKSTGKSSKQYSFNINLNDDASSKTHNNEKHTK